MRTTRVGIAIALLLGLLLGAAGPAWAGEPWVHVRVIERGGETIHVNLPLSTIENLLPLIEAEGLERGRIRIDDDDAEGLDLRAMWQALRESPDGDYVTIKGNDADVRVARRGEHLLATIREEGGDQVRVRVPVAVLDALFSGGRDTLDVAAAVRALRDRGDGELVRVEGGDAEVRVWVDDDQDGQ